MADIVVRGMEIPRWCSACACNSMHYCQVLKRDVSDFLMTNKFPEDCPLVPLPSGHGDLIDKQAFKADIDGFIECMTKVGAVVDGEMLWGKLLDALENAKPIVPTEGGDNE